VSSGNWNPKKALAYLSYFCLKTDLASKILEHSMNMKLYEYLSSKADDPSTQGARKTIEKDKEKNPSLYEKCSLPATWLSNVPLHSYHDVPMHLYSGLVKAVMKLTVAVLKRRGMFGSLLTAVARGNFNSYDKMNLPWFPLIQYKTDKFASYSCSNHIALGRYLKSHCCDIIALKEPDPVELPPQAQQSQWNKVFNYSWLALRDLDTKGNYLELRERVAKWMVDPECPSPSKHTELKLEDVVRMLCSTYNVLSHLLAKKVDDTHLERAHLSILRCLNDIDYVDSLIIKKGETHLTERKYNLVCLLNSKMDAMRYGCARD